MDYYTSIRTKHCFVSFSESNKTFYISLWNGVLRDGKIDDIDILFFEARNPTIKNNNLCFDDTIVELSPIHLKYLTF
jgi:hypothetical protein